MNLIKKVKDLFSRRTDPLGFEILIPFSFPTESAKKEFSEKTNKFLNNKIIIL